MRILIITDKPPWPGTSGGAVAVNAGIKGLLYNGAEVSVLSASTKKHHSQPHKPVDGPGNLKHYETVNIKTRITVLNLLINLLFSRVPYNVVRFRSARFRKKLMEILSGNDFDIIQVEGINMSLYMPLMKQHSRALLSYRAHNIESEIWDELAAGARYRIKQWYLRSLALRMKEYEMSLIDRCDLIIPITEHDSLFFKEKGADIPVFACGFGVDPEQASKADEPQEQSLVYIGSLDWRPNQEGITWFLDRVWYRVLESCPGITLRIAGRNAPGWLIRKCNQAKVEFAGEVEDAGSFIRTGTLLIVPLLSGSGIRVRIIQAMALGIPVVCTPKAAQGIDANPDEELLIARNPEEFKDHILTLMNESNLRSRLITKAEEFIKKQYDNNRLTAGLMEFYAKKIT
jgi:glycosyltransferase involved in cell wall biosynthesis